MRRFASVFFCFGHYLAAASLRGQISKSLPYRSLVPRRGFSERLRGQPNLLRAARTDSGDRHTTPTPAGTVSVEQLQHPLSRKGERLIRQGAEFLAMGDHEKAIAEFQLALKERSAIPYAHSLLGSEYLKINRSGRDRVAGAGRQTSAADAVNHANLGYACSCWATPERAEQEVRRALDLDRNNAKTRLVLGLITHAGGKA